MILVQYQQQCLHCTASEGHTFNLKMACPWPYIACALYSGPYIAYALYSGPYIVYALYSGPYIAYALYSGAPAFSRKGTTLAK